MNLLGVALLAVGIVMLLMGLRRIRPPGSRRVVVMGGPGVSEDFLDQVRTKVGARDSGSPGGWIVAGIALSIVGVALLVWRQL